MSTPVLPTNKPITRSSNKKQQAGNRNSEGASPNLQSSRKRKGSLEPLQDEPAAKKMADNQLLEAINGIKTSVNAMEQQLKAAPTKADFASLVNEIKGVRESVIRNTDRIDTLYDLRKMDSEHLTKRVEKLVLPIFKEATKPHRTSTA